MMFDLKRDVRCCYQRQSGQSVCCPCTTAFMPSRIVETLSRLVRKPLLLLQAICYCWSAMRSVMRKQQILNCDEARARFETGQSLFCDCAQLSARQNESNSVPALQLGRQLHAEGPHPETGRLRQIAVAISMAQLAASSGRQRSFSLMALLLANLHLA